MKPGRVLTVVVFGGLTLLAGMLGLALLEVFGLLPGT
jgi:hypothetical protein